MARRLLALTGVALGLTVAAMPTLSLAHNVGVGTKVSRVKLPRGVLDPGQRVIIFGRVAAVDSACETGLAVQLLRRVPGTDRVLNTDITDVEGEYSFLRRPRGDQRLYVRFGGLQDVVPGHAHSCGASVSREILLEVRR